MPKVSQNNSCDATGQSLRKERGVKRFPSMNFVVIGTDHRAQMSDGGFETLLVFLLARQYIEPLCTVAEEWDGRFGNSICQQLAAERKLAYIDLEAQCHIRYPPWVIEEQTARRKLGQCYRVPSDDCQRTRVVE